MSWVDMVKQGLPLVSESMHGFNKTFSNEVNKFFSPYVDYVTPDKTPDSTRYFDNQNPLDYLSKFSDIDPLTYLDRAQAISLANTAKSQSFAREQMAFQERQNVRAMDFNAYQAKLNRDWQERLANTAKQRQMADLKAAGLNPVLAVMNGQGAPVGSGAQAAGVASAGAAGDVDVGATQVTGAVIGSLINALTNVAVSGVNAASSVGVAGVHGEYGLASSVLSAKMANYLPLLFLKYGLPNLEKFGDGVLGFIENLLSSLPEESNTGKGNLFGLGLPDFFGFPDTKPKGFGRDNNKDSSVFKSKFQLLKEKLEVGLKKFYGTPNKDRFRYLGPFGK